MKLSKVFLAVAIVTAGMSSIGQTTGAPAAGGEVAPQI